MNIVANSFHPTREGRKSLHGKKFFIYTSRTPFLVQNGLNACSSFGWEGIQVWYRRGRLLQSVVDVSGVFCRKVFGKVAHHTRETTHFVLSLHQPDHHVSCSCSNSISSQANNGTSLNYCVISLFRQIRKLAGSRWISPGWNKRNNKTSKEPPNVGKNDKKMASLLKLMISLSERGKKFCLFL